MTLANDPLPEEEEEDDPEYLDDLSNKIQQIVNKGLLVGCGQYPLDFNIVSMMSYSCHNM